MNNPTSYGNNARSVTAIWLGVAGLLLIAVGEWCRP